MFLEHNSPSLPLFSLLVHLCGCGAGIYTFCIRLIGWFSSKIVFSDIFFAAFSVSINSTVPCLIRSIWYYQLKSLDCLWLREAVFGAKTFAVGLKKEKKKKANVHDRAVILHELSWVHWKSEQSITFLLSDSQDKGYLRFRLEEQGSVTDGLTPTESRHHGVSLGLREESEDTLFWYCFVYRLSTNYLLYNCWKHFTFIRVKPLRGGTWHKSGDTELCKTVSRGFFK